MTVGLLYPGQMGASLARVINRTMPVITCLAGRSVRTQRLAAEAGIELVESLQELVRRSDILLSVLVPDKAVEVASEVAAAARELRNEAGSSSKLFVDLNAIAPSSVLQLTERFEGTGIAVVDGGIIGGPASESYLPLVVLSGPAAGQAHAALEPAFKERIKVVGEEIGQASALKLSYASLTKGSIGLVLNSSLLASKHGVLEHLNEELEASQPAIARILQNAMPSSVAKSFRWVGEMEEISQAMSDAQLEGGAQIFQGEAKTYAQVAANEEIGKESIEESVRKGRDYKAVLKALG